MYYQHSIAALRSAIKLIEPNCEAVYSDPKPGTVVSLPYLLWMCDQVTKMDTSSVDECAKAGRWIGWIFAHAEMHNLLNNNETRDLVRHDRSVGLDKPHHD